MLLFKIDWREHVVVTMLAFWVVEKLDIIKHVVSGGFPVPVDFPAYPLALQQIEKALCDRIVIAITTAAHAGFQIVGLQELLPLITGKLAALI